MTNGEWLASLDLPARKEAIRHIPCPSRTGDFCTFDCDVCMNKWLQQEHNPKHKEDPQDAQK